MVIFPAYYAHFRCSASACTDSCCRNWEIDIDPASLRRYRSHRGPLQQRFTEAISIDGDAHFILQENGRCPFLNEQNLCDIYAVMGQEALCDICAEHPRFYTEWGSDCFGGVGLCCEEAAKLILDESQSDEIAWDSMAAYTGKPTALGTVFREWYEHPDSFLPQLLTANQTETYAALISALLQLEILSPLWTTWLTDLCRNLPTVAQNQAAFIRRHPTVETQYRRLARYFWYRYGLQTRNDDDPERGILASRQLVKRCVMLIALLDTWYEWKNNRFALKNQVTICKLFSQEIEYDETNIAFLKTWQAEG